MKRLTQLTLAFLFIVFCSSCEREEQKAKQNELVFTAVYADDESSMMWENGDEVKLFCEKGSGKFVANTAASSQSTEITGTLVNGETWTYGTSVTGLFPFSDAASIANESVRTVFPSSQRGEAGSVAHGMNVAIAESSGWILKFINVGGGIRFTVKTEGVKTVTLQGMNDEVIAGNISIDLSGGKITVTPADEGVKTVTLSAPDGGSFEVGKWYYISTLPTAFNYGVSMTFSTSDKYATVKLREPVTVKSGVFTSIAEADRNAVFIEKGVDPWDCKSLTLQERLLSLPDVVNVEKMTTSIMEYPEGVYKVCFSLPIDHNNPSAGRFTNKTYVGIRHTDSLNVVSMTGYSTPTPESHHVNVLTGYFNSNEIFLEHRDFDKSSTGTDFAYLTTAQAAADQMQMIDNYRLMFKRRYAVTGASKGGICTALLAGYYPDFDAVFVANVAPFCRNIDDLKGHKFYLEEVGTPELRARVLRTQRKLLVLKDSTSVMEDFKSMMGSCVSELSTSLTDLFYYVIQDYGTMFWQNGASEYELPDEELSGRELWDNISFFGLFPIVVSSFGESMRPYNVQAKKELGSFGYYHNMSDIYVPEQLSAMNAVLPDKYQNLPYNDGETYDRYIDLAVSLTDKPMLFIYGGQDAWTQNALDDKYVNGKNVRKYIIPGISHGANVALLPEPEKTDVINWLKQNMYK